MITVIAEFFVKPDKIEEAIEAAKEIVSHVKNEKETLAYSVSQASNEPYTLVFTEKYTSKEALKSHSSTQYFNDFIKKTESLTTKPPTIKILKEIAGI